MSTFTVWNSPFFHFGTLPICGHVYVYSPGSYSHFFKLSTNFPITFYMSSLDNIFTTSRSSFVEQYGPDNTEAHVFISYPKSPCHHVEMEQSRRVSAVCLEWCFGCSCSCCFFPLGKLCLDSLARSSSLCFCCVFWL